MDPTATEENSSRYHYVDSIGEADFSATAVLEALRQSHIEVEAEKSTLARALHDDLGGLLVGAIMDIGWIAQQTGGSKVTKDKLARAIGLLRSAIDIKRTMIENVRPSLLDDVGLFAALRWHLQASCDAADVVYTDSYPAEEMAFSSEFKICVFRIVQRSLGHLLADGARSALSLDVGVNGSTLHCLLESRLVEPRVRASETTPSEIATQYSARHLDGSLVWLKTVDGDHVDLKIPMPAAS
jgi:hypothetical protein